MTKPTTENTGYIGMLSSIFRDISTHGDKIGEHWRGVGADSLDTIAKGLDAGLPPDEVAIVCRSLAGALRYPERLESVQSECEAAIAGLQARKELEEA